MKAELDEKGVLLVIAETGLESFALKCWHEKHRKSVGEITQCEVVFGVVFFGEAEVKK